MNQPPVIPPSSFLTLVGQTPCIRLGNCLPDEVPPQVEIWAKLESVNPSGSVKARAALNIILDAEASGRLRPGLRRRRVPI